MNAVRSLLILGVVSLFSCNAYSFWIWSPKTNKWKNPKYSAQVTPYLQYREAVKYFEKKSYKRALKEFKKLIVNYPDAYESAESQYYLGRCYQEMRQPYPAFLEYKKVIESYPNSKRIEEVVQYEYDIGEYFFSREAKRWMGVSKYDFMEHPSVEIFKIIIDKTPYSQYAPLAQYKLAVLFMQLTRFQEAREEFSKLIEAYPESEWALPSKYQLAIATAKAFPGAEYDSSSVKEAVKQLDAFIKDHPQAQVISAATAQLIELRNKEAEKNFNIAVFYEKQKKYTSAVVYYRIVLQEYPDSGYAASAGQKLKELEKDDQ